MGLRRAGGWLAVLVCAFGGCQWAEQWRAESYRQYHAARFAAVAQAFAVPRAGFTLPGGTEVPNACRERLEPAYAALAAQGFAEELSWRALLQQAEADCRFARQTVEAVTARDSARVAVLAPQIAENLSGLNRLRDEYAAQQAQTDAVLAELKRAWQARWPEQDLDFDLTRALAAARRDLPAPPPELAAELARFHANEYARLAMIYLDYHPDPLPDPLLKVPAAAGALGGALTRLESGLAARCALDEAVQTDVELVRELTGATGPAVDWAALAPPQAKYQAVRFDTALARLKLYKYLDQLVTADLDLLCRELDLSWGRCWPQSGVETNIFAFAGLVAQDEPAPAAASAALATAGGGAEYAEWTFRRSITQWAPPK